MTDNQINKLPKNWTLKTLGEVCERIHYGYTASSTKDNTGVKLLRITDIQDYKVDWEDVPFCKISENDFEKYKLSKGDLLFARTGATVGKSFLIKKEIPNSVFASYLIRVIPQKKMDISFIYLFFQSTSYWSQIKESSVGIGQTSVNGTILAKLQIPLPPLPEQQKIVQKIESLFAHLETGTTALETALAQLKIYRQAVLNEFYEDKNSECESVCIGEIANVGTGITPLKSNKLFYENGTIPWVTSGALNNLFVLTANEHITEYALQKTSLKIYPKHTLLVALYGEGKTRGKASELLIEATTNQAIAGIVLKSEFEESRAYLKWFLIKNYEDIRKLSAGGVQPNLNLSIIKNTSFPFPPLKIQTQIVSEIEKRMAGADALECIKKCGANSF